MNLEDMNKSGLIELIESLKEDKKIAYRSNGLLARFNKGISKENEELKERIEKLESNAATFENILEGRRNEIGGLLRDITDLKRQIN